MTALKDVLAKMDFRQVGPGWQADDAGRTDARPAPAERGTSPSTSARARALWGRFPDYLKPDPDAVRYPDLDEPGVDAAGRLRVRYGDTPSGINPLTTSDARVSDQIELYCLAAARHPHTSSSPSFYDQGLAIRVEKSPDYKEWVVWLRDDVLLAPAAGGPRRGIRTSRAGTTSRRTT